MKNSLQHKVSVVISTYKRDFFLLKTLDSILKQTYTNLQIIVISDQESKSTENLLKNINDDRIEYYAISHSGRPAVPRNVGLKHATGEFIAFCDDDDIWDKEKICLQIEAFNTNPEIQMCYTNYSLIDEYDEKISLISQKLQDNQSQTTFSVQLYKNKITFSTVMIRRNILLNELKFDERKILKASEDFLFLTKVVSTYPILYLNKELIKYRIHKNGISFSNGDIKKLFMFYIRMILCLYHLFIMKKISMLKFFHLLIYHFKQVLKQILYPYLKLFIKNKG